MSPWYPLRVVFWLSYEVDTRIAWAIDRHPSPFYRMLVDQVDTGFGRPYVIDEKANQPMIDYLSVSLLSNMSVNILWRSTDLQQ